MRLFRFSLLLMAGISMLPAEDRAVLVGIGKYNDAHRNLPGIEKDLAATSTALVSNLGFRQSQLHVLKDEQATEQAIRREIQGWLSGAGPNDRAVFYYSGHGSLAKDGAGVVGILVPYDIVVKNGSLLHALPGPDLGMMFGHLASRHLLVVIDACHSGHLTDNTRGVGVVDKFFTYEGMPTGDADLTLRPLGVAKGIAQDETANYVLLSACRRNESAAATANGSVLTQTMAESFRQMQASRKPVTISGAHSQISQTLASSSFRDKQHPEVSGTPNLTEYNWATRGIAPDPAPQAVPQPAPPPQPTPQPPPTPRPATPPRPQPAPRVTPAPPAPVTEAQPVSEDWELLRSLFEKRGGDLHITIGATAYRRGDELMLQVRVPAEGYLNVLSIGKGDASATVLFPNEFVGDNHVTPGVVSLPGKYNFKLEQDLPPGVPRQENRLLVVFTDKPMNLFADGEGKGTFRSLGQRTRSTVVKARDTVGQFAAGYVTYFISQK